MILSQFTEVCKQSLPCNQASISLPGMLLSMIKQHVMYIKFHVYAYRELHIEVCTCILNGKLIPLTDIMKMIIHVKIIIHYWNSDILAACLRRLKTSE